MKYIRGLLLALLLLPAGIQAGFAQFYSYVYIQGDKSIPFYVKLEGEMMPRYGKNYCIIPRLETGLIQIEILFQQNTYPPHAFTIKVPENGCRGFLLTRQGENFALFDLHQGFYLQADNDPSADHMPVKEVIEGTQTHAPETGAGAPNAAPLPGTGPIARSTSAGSAPSGPTSSTSAPTAPVGIAPTPASPGTPRFIEDIELDNEPNAGTERVVASQPSTVPEVASDTAQDTELVEPVQKEPGVTRTEEESAPVRADDTEMDSEDLSAAIVDRTTPAGEDKVEPAHGETAAVVAEETVSPGADDNTEAAQDETPAVVAQEAVTPVLVDSVEPAQEATPVVAAEEKAAPTHANSDCPQPLAAGRFEVLYAKALRLKTEESRLGYLNSQLQQCYSTAQAERLARTVDSDAARYSWLKKVYPRITDPENFGNLDTLFSNEDWKSHFLELIPQ
jgi:hypothetical protein